MSIRSDNERGLGLLQTWRILGICQLMNERPACTWILRSQSERVVFPLPCPAMGMILLARCVFVT